MACTAFNPATGLFINAIPFSTTPSSGSWHFSYDRDQGGSKVYQLIHSGSVEDELFLPGGGDIAVSWKYSGNYLWVLHANIGLSSTVYRLYVYTLDASASSLTPNELTGGPFESSASSPQFRLFPSQDGELYFIHMADNAANSTHTHRVYRSSNNDLICSEGSVTTIAERQARVTADNEVKIMFGGDIRETCPLPRGECQVSPSTGVFSEAVVGGPAALASTTLVFTISNDGSDCFTVQSIGNVAPFTVTSTSETLPADLDPTDSMTVEVTFTPVATDSFAVSLPVTTSPVAGDCTLECEGTAIDPIASISVSPGSIGFGTWPVSNPPTTRTLTLTNTGQLPLNVSVASSTPGSAISWAAFSDAFPYGASHDITVTFDPTAEADYDATLTVNSDAPTSPDNVGISGRGCIPESEIYLPSTAQIDFEQVERGFRMVGIFRIVNRGDGPLTFRASIANDTFSLFGLQPESGDVNDVLTSRNYTVDPVTACGSISTGSGEALIGVAFHAGAEPATINAELVIDNHNDPHNATASWTIPLRAEIIALENLDAVVVLDRSGSMTDPLGDRRKMEAAISGAQLFIQLMRVNVDDRAAIIKYNHESEVVAEMDVIETMVDRTTLANRINLTEFDPTGSTAIAAGVMLGLKEFDRPRTTVPPILNKAMAVLTDGKDNAGYLNPDDSRWYSVLGGSHVLPDASGFVDTEPMPLPTDVKMYGIGLGTSESLGMAELERLSTDTGSPFLVTDNLSGANYFNLEKYFTEIFMDMARLVPLSDPVFNINVGEQHRVEFDVLRGDVSALVVIYDREGLRLPFHLETPLGEIIEVATVPPGFQLRAGISPTARYIEVLMPQGEENRYAGRWTVGVAHNGEVCFGGWGFAVQPEATHYTASDRAVPSAGTTVNDLPDMQFGFVSAEQCAEWPAPIVYGLCIGVGSNFRMQPYVTPGTVKVGEAIWLDAVVSEAGLPTTGCNVTVKATSPSGRVEHLILYDDGLHDDGEPESGEYANFFTRTNEGGSYTFLFRAEGTTRDGEPVVREATRSKYVQDRIPVDPDDRLTPEPGGTIKDCCNRLFRLLWVAVILLVMIALILLFRW